MMLCVLVSNECVIANAHMLEGKRSAMRDENEEKKHDNQSYDTMLANELA